MSKNWNSRKNDGFVDIFLPFSFLLIERLMVCGGVSPTQMMVISYYQLILALP
jgi:hypothetical protein